MNPLKLLFILVIAVNISWLSSAQTLSASNSTTTTHLSLPLSTSSSTTVRKGGGIVAPPKRNVPGLRYSLSTGRMYIPDYFHAGPEGEFDLLFFFHGAAWCSEQNFYDSRKNAILVSISLADYQKYFQDTTRFRKLQQEVNYVLESTKLIPHPRLHKLAMSSFSGGYSAVREILRTPDYLNQVSELVLADSLYANYTDTTRKYLAAGDMKPYLDFAGQAALKKKSFWFTQLYPPDPQYRDNNTTVTARYLIDKLGLVFKDRNETQANGMKLLYLAEKGNCHIMGYAGMTNQDHFNHFYNISEYWKKLTFADGPPIQPTNPNPKP